MVPRPVEQVVDEVQQRRVRPLEIFEDEHRRALLCEPLEEEAPGGEEVFTVGRDAFLEPEQLGEPRLDPGALLGVGEVLLERLPELAGRRLGILLLGDSGPHAHHLGERPVRDAVAVGETAAAMPVDVAHQPVDVALELRREPRLADPGDPENRDEPRPALVARGVEEILDQAQLPLPAHKRRLETGCAALAAARRDHPRGSPERHRLRLALELVRARVLVGDRGLARAPGALSDEHGAGRRGRLHPRGRVDQVSGDHALALGADRDCGLPRDDADSHGQPLAEGCHDLDEL